MEWVSVDERLPELETSVLLWVSGEYPCAISGWRETDPEEYTPEEWANEDGMRFPASYSTDEWGIVTHWMPLPDPPESD